ncbi:aquaporin [Nocardioides sp. C4-1]|uniref:MIP/aquaporin family protein n=1 Tax=Nocardioides sp. C4-1 TaxID=3151851 RepID=UPI00326399CE
MSSTDADAQAPASPPTLAQRLSAEALGTLVIVVAAVGGSAGFGIDAFSTGVATLAAMFALGRWSGGHFNPAVTVGSALGGRTSWGDALPMIGAQLAGGIVAGLLAVIYAFGFEGFEFWDSNLGGNALGDSLSDLPGGESYALWAGLLVTLVVSVLFVLLFLGLTDERNEQRSFAPIGVGFAAVVAVATTASATGGSVNLAQSFGLGLVSGGEPLWQGLVIGIVTVIGGAAAGFLYPALFGADRAPVPGSGLNFGSSSPAQGGYPQGGYDQQQWGQPGGYQQPQQGGYAAPGAAQPTPQAEQPIIQDGWQWDPQAQQWIPAQQQPPQGWPSQGGGEQTQVRPQDGS